MRGCRDKLGKMMDEVKITYEEIQNASVSMWCFEMINPKLKACYIVRLYEIT
jgi:hypothetical protein